MKNENLLSCGKCVKPRAHGATLPGGLRVRGECDAHGARTRVCTVHERGARSCTVRRQGLLPPSSLPFPHSVNSSVEARNRVPFLPFAS